MKAMRNLWVAVLLGLLAWGQGAPRKPASKRSPQKPATAAAAIETIEVEGAKKMAPAQIIEISGLKTGMEPTKQVFEAARDKVIASGCIETIGWRYEPAGTGYKAVLMITEVGQWLPWTIDRLPDVDAKKFDEALRAKLPCVAKEAPATDVFLRESTSILQGMTKEPVAARVELVGKDQLSIVYQPKAPPPNVAEVYFNGNKAIPTVELQRSIAQVAIGTPYREQLFRTTVENQTRAMYEALGRLRVTFPRITTAPAKGVVNGAAVTVEVNEGDVYTLKDIAVRGTPLGESEIMELGKFPLNKPANYSDIGLGMQQILQRMRNLGYLKASYDGKRRLDDQAKTVELWLDVESGAQFRMGKLEIKGLDIEGEPAVRKIWKMQPGEPFNDEYPDSFLRGIRERRMFDFLGETKAEKLVDEKRGVVDVRLVFKGGPQPLDSRPAQPPQ
jgi:outer membrane protein assembly factor BamA